MLIFRDELARKAMAGEKTQTRRALSDNPRSPWWRDRCAHEVGSIHAVCPGRSQFGIGFVVVEDVSLVRLGQITNDGAIAEGCADVPDFMATWEAINGTWDERQRVWLLRFRVATDADMAAP